MKLTEIKKLLGLAPAEFSWLDDSRCVFTIKGADYGISVEYLELQLQTRQLTAANISFGTIERQFDSAEDVQQQLTGRNSFQRTIFSTVAEAVLQNTSVMECDILVLGSSDAFKDQRDMLYTMAASELAQRGSFPGRKLWRATTANGTKLILLSRVQLSDDEQRQILQKLHLNKDAA